jgi:predicted AAA+ superfamily ATPase
MLGQLQDAGNTTTLAHYLDLLQSAGLLAGLSKYAGQRVRQRASSPKFIVLNTALMSASGPNNMGKTKLKPDHWGRWVESAVGSSLANGIIGKNIELFYWSSRNREVDFVLSRNKEVVAIEVKSGRNKGSFPGIEAFSKEFKVKRKLLVGHQGISLREFLLTPPEELFD